MKGPDKFLTKEGLAEIGKELHLKAVNEETREKEGNLYTFDRQDGRDVEAYDSISELHGISFVEEVIPSLLAKKKNGEKVKILDVGAGAAFFTDEIRKIFGEKVKVLSTGLSKKTAEEHRSKSLDKEKAKLNPNDLKWRSILQLTDFEEFDLIIDTLGEFLYSVESKSKNLAEAQESAINYLTVVIRKLKPGGMASIMPAKIAELVFGGRFEEVLNILAEQYEVKIYLKDGRFYPKEVLIIEKPEK